MLCTAGFDDIPCQGALCRAGRNNTFCISVPSERRRRILIKFRPVAKFLCFLKIASLRLRYNTMNGTTSILLFGDQTGDYRTTLDRVLRIRDNPLLTAFFDRSYAALRQEVAKQPRSVRNNTTGFTSVADLVARYAEPALPKSNALESALTYISQIACFLRYQGSGTAEYPSESNTHIVGSCTGLLAAAVVSSSRSFVDLLPVAVEVVRIAFRLGSLVNEVRDQIEQSSNQSTSWSVVLPGLCESDAVRTIQNFYEINVRTKWLIPGSYLTCVVYPVAK